MAEAIVSAVVQKALSASIKEIGLLWGFKDDLNRLTSTFGTIQLVLRDAEIKQMKSEAIQNWLWKLKNVAYDVENILDQIATHGLIKQREASEGGKQHQLKSFLSQKNPLLFRFKMVHQMKNIRKRLDAIAKERHDYHLMESVVENRFGETSQSRQTCSLVNDLEILGRDGEKEKIIMELLGSCDREYLSVYAISGMGGLGKTTLAQLVYKDQRTETHFELRIWVCVCDYFSVQRMVRAILESLEGSVCNILELDPLQRRLQEKLKGRRYLLVLDDVWNENNRLWDELKEVLRCGSKGSVLIATTRVEKVAIMMAASTIHHIGCLSEDDSWSVFKRRAFPIGEEKKNLVAIGKVIVKKCGGVPLAINALGSLMQYKSLESEWLAIKESEIWHLIDDEYGILPALRLSYDNLLPHMRQCFAYCSTFPKDYKMKKDELIQLWMANSYLHSDGQTDLYLMGQMTFKELVWRFFLQDVEISSDGVTRCKMHDLMHDLALSVNRHETCILKHGNDLKIPKTPRHLSFYSSSSWEVLVNKREIKLLTDDSLWSIIAPRVQESAEGLSSLISKQQYLRVLALDTNYRPTFFPIPAVCKLKHLRYLVLSCSTMQKLPESLTRLINLQTLKLMNSKSLLELPKGLRLMKNLWFLEMSNFDSLVCTPPGLGDIIVLHKLSVFIVGEDADHEIDQLKELNLAGELSIKRLQNLRNLEDAKSANLITKCDLTSLSLSWEKGIQQNFEEHFDEVLEGLQPHPDLENICIQSYQGSMFPNWVSNLAFRRLKKIRLEDCRDANTFLL